MAVKELSEIRNLLLTTEFKKRDREEVIEFLDLNCRTPCFYDILEEVFKITAGRKIPDGQREFINEVVHFSKEKFLFMLKHILKRLNSTSIESEHDRLSFINESLQVCLDILRSYVFFINQILLISPIETSYLCDSPLVALEMLEYSFKHCSQSQSAYGQYLSACHEKLSSVFMMSVELQTVLFKAFCDNYIFNLNAEEDLFFVDEVLKRVSTIGEIIVFLDSKSTVNLWKMLTGLISKFPCCERQKLNIAAVFKSLSLSLSWKIASIPKKQDTFDNNVLASLKLCNFIMKVIIKLCSLFANNIGEPHFLLIKMLIRVYGKDQRMEVSAGSPNHFNTYVTAGASTLLSHLVKDQDFIKEFCELCSNLENITNKSTLGVYSLTIKVLKKIISETWAVQQMWLENDFIEHTLKVIQQCSGFLNKTVFFSAKEGHSCLVSGLAVLMVSTLNNSEFRKIEKILFSRLFEGNYMLKVFISDLLCMLARLTTEQMVIKWIHWLRNIPSRPGNSNAHFSVLQRRLLKFLSPKSKKSLERRPLKPFKHAPKKNPTTANFNILVQELSACNTICEQDLLLKLWHASRLLWPASCIESPGARSWFSQMLEALTGLTVLSIPSISNYHLSQVLKEVSAIGKYCEAETGLRVVRVLGTIVLSVLQRDDKICLDFGETARSMLSCPDPIVGLSSIEALLPLLTKETPPSSNIQRMKSNLFNDPVLKPCLESFTRKEVTPGLSSLIQSVTNNNLNNKCVPENSSKTDTVYSDAPPTKKMRPMLDLDVLIEKSSNISLQIEDQITGTDSLSKKQRESLFNLISKYESLKNFIK